MMFPLSRLAARMRAMGCDSATEHTGNEGKKVMRIVLIGIARHGLECPVSWTPSMAYFERRTLTFIEYARGGNHELNGIAGRTPGQLTTSWRQAIGRDEAEG
jgi:hypothetical protein